MPKLEIPVLRTGIFKYKIFNFHNGFFQKKNIRYNPNFVRLLNFQFFNVSNIESL